jgi:hypothetical protein
MLLLKVKHGSRTLETKQHLLKLTQLSQELEKPFLCTLKDPSQLNGISRLL